jgi:hypothetical protein
VAAAVVLLGFLGPFNFLCLEFASKKFLKDTGLLVYTLSSNFASNLDSMFLARTDKCLGNLYLASNATNGLARLATPSGASEKGTPLLTEIKFSKVITTKSRFISFKFICR